MKLSRLRRKSLNALLLGGTLLGIGSVGSCRYPSQNYTLGLSAIGVVALACAANLHGKAKKQGMEISSGNVFLYELTSDEKQSGNFVLADQRDLFSPYLKSTNPRSLLADPAVWTEESAFIASNAPFRATRWAFGERDTIPGHYQVIYYSPKKKVT